MIHPHTELRFIGDEIGYGVVATRFIPKGTITWVLDKLDREFTPSEFENLDDYHREILETYTYRNRNGNLVLCWDLGKYVNHSFHSNCLTTAYDFEVAIRDIQPGEQLTDDYGYLNISRPFRAMDEGARRKTVYPDDLVKYHRIWDRKLRAAIPQLSKVNQPLWHLLTDQTRETIQEIIERQKEMDSILNCYYNQESFTGSNGRAL